MKKQNLLNIIKSGSINIPLYIFKIKNELKIDTDTFIILMYLINYNEEKIVFNPMKISKDLNINLEEVMKYIDLLINNKLISVDVIKNEKNIMEDYINLELFYNKLNNLLIDEVNNNETDNNFFSIFEREIGRCISPMEYEIINAWLDSNTSEELILEALKEAIMNGTTALKYIDKIIYEWNRKGFKTKEDVEKDRINFRKKKEVKREKKEVFDYNWLEDNDE